MTFYYISAYGTLPHDYCKVRYGTVRGGPGLAYINPAHDCQKSTIALHTYIGEEKAFFKAKNISRKVIKLSYYT